MFLEDERRHIWRLALPVDDRKLNVRIIFRYEFHDRRLCETHANDEIEIAFGESTHCRFDRVCRSRFDVAQDDRKIFRRALHALPRSSVERTIVLAADVENDPNAYLRVILGGRRFATSSQTQRHETNQCDKNQQFVFHSLITSLTSFSSSAGVSSPTRYAAWIRRAASSAREDSAQ